MKRVKQFLGLLSVMVLIGTVVLIWVRPAWGANLDQSGISGCR
jgi:hypothetical protein